MDDFLKWLSELKAAELIALAAVGVTFMTWAGSAAAQAVTGWRSAEIESWRRLQELTAILNNGSTTGAWAQELAIAELLHQGRRKDEARHLLQEARTFWAAKEPPSHLVAHLDAALMKIDSRT